LKKKCSAVRNALAAGITPEEIKQVVIPVITTLVFPEAMRAMTWIGGCLSDYNKEMES